MKCNFMNCRNILYCAATQKITLHQLISKLEAFVLIKYEFFVTKMTAFQRVSHFSRDTLRIAVNTVTTNSYLLFYASDLHAFNLSDKLKIYVY